MESWDYNCRYRSDEEDSLFDEQDLRRTKTRTRTWFEGKSWVDNEDNMQYQDDLIQQELLMSEQQELLMSEQQELLMSEQHNINNSERGTGHGHEHRHFGEHRPFGEHRHFSMFSDPETTKQSWNGEIQSTSGYGNESGHHDSYIQQTDLDTANAHGPLNQSRSRQNVYEDTGRASQRYGHNRHHNEERQHKKTRHGNESTFVHDSNRPQSKAVHQSRTRKRCGGHDDEQQQQQRKKLGHQGQDRDTPPSRRNDERTSTVTTGSMTRGTPSVSSAKKTLPTKTLPIKTLPTKFLPAKTSTPNLVLSSSPTLERNNRETLNSPSPVRQSTLTARPRPLPVQLPPAKKQPPETDNGTVQHRDETHLTSITNENGQFVRDKDSEGQSAQNIDEPNINTDKLNDEPNINTDKLNDQDHNESNASDELIEFTEQEIIDMMLSSFEEVVEEAVKAVETIKAGTIKARMGETTGINETTVGMNKDKDVQTTYGTDEDGKGENKKDMGGKEDRRDDEDGKGENKKGMVGRRDKEDESNDDTRGGNKEQSQEKAKNTHKKPEQTKKPKRMWTTQSLKALMDYAVADDRYKGELDDAINNTLVKRVFNNNLWRKSLIFEQGTSLKNMGKLSRMSFEKKMKFKEVAKPGTSDFGIELVKKMSRNLLDAEADRKRIAVELARCIDNSMQANIDAWKLFLQDVKEGKNDALTVD